MRKYWLINWVKGKMSKLKIDVDRVCNFLKELGKFALAQQKSVSIETADVKGWNELVTFVDKALEERLHNFLPEIFNADILSEEMVAGLSQSEVKQRMSKKEWWWIVDPLDGTTNYVHGLPCFSISVALANMESEDIVAGFIHDIPANTTYWAIKGEGARQEQKPIYVSQNNTQKHYLIATGFPYRDYSRAQEYMKVFEIFMRETQGLRRMGSASIDLAYTASGKFDGFFEYGLKIWDVAAGVLIVQEAGGKVTDFSGGKDFLFGEEIIAGNNSCHSYMLSRIKQTFK